MIVTGRQGGDVAKYKYFLTVFEYILQVSVLSFYCIFS